MIETVLNATKQIHIFAKDKNFRYLFCNEAVAEASGSDSPAQLIGKTDYDTLWKPQADLYRQGDKKVIQGSIMINMTEPQTQRIGTKMMLVTKTILTDKQGYFNGIAGHAIDITGHSFTKKNGYSDPQKNIFYLGEHFANEYLTKSEFVVFKYLLQGKCVEEIATTLSRSQKTIQTQIKSIANKLQCSHKSEIVPTAIQFGLAYLVNDEQ